MLSLGYKSQGGRREEASKHLAPMPAHLGEVYLVARFAREALQSSAGPVEMEKSEHPIVCLYSASFLIPKCTMLKPEQPNSLGSKRSNKSAGGSYLKFL